MVLMHTTAAWQLAGLALVMLGFGWAAAIPLMITAASALYAKKGHGGSSSGQGGNYDAMNGILAQQQAQVAQEAPLRQMLLRQQAGMLPTYMKNDPSFQSWLAGSAGGASSAMNPMTGGIPGGPGGPRGGFGYNTGTGIQQAAPSWSQTFGEAPRGWKYDTNGNLVHQSAMDKWSGDIMPALVMGAMTGGLGSVAASGVASGIGAYGHANIGSGGKNPYYNPNFTQGR